MYMHPGLSMAEVDTHASRLKYIGTPVELERSSGIETTQVVDAHSVAA